MLACANRELGAAVVAALDATAGSTPRLFYAPGRVNLIGEHVDYCGGPALPMPIDRGVYVAARLRDDGAVRLRALDAPEGWERYPRAVLEVFADATGCRGGLEVAAGGDVPIGAGLSSSAALSVAVAVALDALHATRLPASELARIAHRAEVEHVGVPCGIMDQYASALGRAGQALWLHGGLVGAWEHVTLPDDLSVLVMDTKTRRQLAGSDAGYAARVRQCAAALQTIEQRVGARGALARCSLEDLVQAQPSLPDLQRRRARHVITETARVGAAVTALRRRDLAALGALLDASHASGRDDHQVSCAELDAITVAARAVPGVFGARFVGAGFGGCAIALVRPDAVAATQRAVAADYAARFGITPDFALARSGAGAGERRFARPLT